VEVQQARDAIERGRDLNAFISLTDETGDGPVVAVKDLVDVRGTVTTGGGAAGLLPSEPAEADARLIGEMRRYGCVVVGKTNLHEWAFGISSDNPHWGTVRNPHDRERIPGGSSGGSAVAVVAGMCDWAVGSDTGGSIRIPAALCGCVGIKPSLGMLSTEGVVPLSKTLDTMGPLAPDLTTAARALEMMSGGPGLVPEDPLAEPALAIPKGWFGDLDEPTRTAWEAVTVGLREVDFPGWQELGAPGTTILDAEAADFHKERVEGAAEKIGADVLANLRRGLQVTAVDYLRALEDQEVLADEVEAAMTGLDALLVPTCPIVAPKIAEAKTVRPLMTRFTRPFNVTGQPVVNLPAPVPDGQLPVGIQVVGHFGADARTIAAAAWLAARWVLAAAPR
jgi:Asp-tRNA(Asn)/Glu-tRNA(Gln) amidotransferase A subunit family amidase